MLHFLTVVLFSISLSLKGTVWTDCRQEFETAAEALHKDGKDPATTAKQARIIGDTVAFVAGRDVASADKAGGNAVENNWWWTLDLYHYGKIYTEGGKEGVIEEIKEHPVEAAFALGGLGFVGRIGKGAKVVGKLAKAEKLEQKTQAVQQEFKFVQKLKPIEKVHSEATEVVKKSSVKPGRVGAQKRLREIKDDPSVSSAWRGWLKQEENAMHKKITKPGTSKGKILRNPPGTELAHPRGMEAAKGYDYSHAHLELKENHAIQHKHDDFGRKNKDRGQK